MAAALPNDAGFASVHTFLLKDRTDYSNCDAVKGRAVAFADLIDGAPREQKMIQIDASEMARQISDTGSVALYGIYPRAATPGPGFEEWARRSSGYSTSSGSP